MWAQLPLLFACETIICVLATLLAASIILSRLWRRSSQHKYLNGISFEDLFVTALGAGKDWWLVGWALLPGTGTGAWAIPLMGFYGYVYGLSGAVVYSISTGLMPGVVAALGAAAYRNIPRTRSLPASMGQCYGPVLELYTLLVMLLATVAVLAVESTALAQIFHEVLQIPNATVLGIVAVLSACDVCFGGALLGLFTSQVHGLLSFAGMLVIAYYLSDVAKGLRAPNHTVLVYGLDKAATLNAFLGMIFGNTTLACLLELFWQKHNCCWKVETMGRANGMSFLLATAFCTFWALPGLLVCWRDMREGGAPFVGDSYLLYLDRRYVGMAIRDVWAPYSFWFGVLYLTYVTVISHTAISASCSALLSSVYGSLRVSKNRLVAARAAAMALNALALILAMLRVNVMGLVTAASMASATLAVPLFLSICCRPLFRVAVGSDILTSALVGLLCCFWYSCVRCVNPLLEKPCSE